MAGTRGGSGPDEAPGKPGEQQRDEKLHGREQERVVVGARVARRADVPPDIEPVREAAAYELGQQRKQRKCKPGAEALVTARALHKVSVPDGRVLFKRDPLANAETRTAIPGRNRHAFATNLPLTRTGVRHRFWRFGDAAG